jgi:hydrogenase small subunit
MPPVDRHGRPLFAYGGLIHNQCERRAHFEFGEFVLSWGDEAAQKGWCLYKMGCKGPETFANCPTVGYADGTSWPVQAGHGCIGCTMPGFWDGMGPAYSRLPPPLPFAPNITADQVGQAALAGVAAVTVVHGAASWVRGRRHHEGERTVQSVRPDTAAVQDPDRPAPPDAPEAERPDPESPPDTSEAERPDPETPPDAPEAERPDPETPPDAPESGRADPETPTTEAGVAEAVLAREPTPDEAFTEPDAGATGEPAGDVG